MYRGNDREVKRCAREDKRAFVEGLVAVDWVMRQTAADKPRDLPCSLFK